jgi:N-acylneuraminate cytidylyltransferase
LEQTENYRPDLLVFLQCTSPLTLSADIDGTVEALLEQDADSAFAAAPFHYFVWQWDSQGSAVGINHDKRHRPRRQDREPQFIETGAVYVMRVDGFRAAKHRFFGKTTLYVMPMERNLEIDALEDFRAAERCMRERQEAQRHRSLPNPVAALVMDFDGVFTDNKVIVMQDGTEAVACSRGDGWGLGHLRRLGLLMLVLSTEKNPVVQARCDKLRLPCIHGVWDKGAALAEWMRSNGVNPAHVIYIGNDVNDLNCFSLVGCPVAVSDAHPDIMAAARIVLSAAGGSGALRELAELIAPSLERNTRA